MKLRHALLALIIPAVSFAHAPAMQSMASVIKRVKPAVVSIMVQKQVDVPQELLQQLGAKDMSKLQLKGVGIGSGVIINAKQGLIATNAHVVDNSKKIIVTLDDHRRFEGHVIAKSDKYDIAVVGITAKHLTQIAFGDSGKVKVGDFVVAIGSPFDLTQTATSGMISAVNRPGPSTDSDGFQSYLQTDTPINPGNSGGALINQKGQLVGINTAIITDNGGNIGLGFAIPSNLAKAALLQLLQYSKIQQGHIGVLVQNIDYDLAHMLHTKFGHGVLVAQVVPGTPAAKAGIKKQDIITKFDALDVDNAQELKDYASLSHPGTKTMLTVIRAGKTKHIEVTVGNGKVAVKDSDNPLSTVQLQRVSGFNSNGKVTSGTQVTDLSPTSKAGLAGLLPGDIIVTVNGKTATESTLESLGDKGASLLLYVKRGDGFNYIAVPGK